jgi:hypothetical protein
MIQWVKTMIQEYQERRIIKAWMKELLKQKNQADYTHELACDECEPDCRDCD